MNIQSHPFPVEASFKTSLVLTYALPKQEISPVLPSCLEPDTFNEQWGFVAVALVDTRDLRPKGFPPILGRDFILAGYRIFVKYRNTNGKRLRGLYILKSETNNRLMSFFGNLFTHYNYTTTDIQFEYRKDRIIVKSIQSGLHIEVEKNGGNKLPETSVFTTLEEARRFAGPLPFTFTVINDQVLIIEGVRQNWVPKPVHVLQSTIGYMNESRFASGKLSNAFIIENIPYYWKKGRLETWKS